MIILAFWPPEVHNGPDISKKRNRGSPICGKGTLLISWSTDKIDKLLNTDIFSEGDKKSFLIFRGFTAEAPAPIQTDIMSFAFKWQNRIWKCDIHYLHISISKEERRATLSPSVRLREHHRSLHLSRCHSFWKAMGWGVVSLFSPKVDIVLPKLFIGCVIASLLS